MAWKHPRGHKATLDLIKSCAASGVGIEHIEEAPNFRFYPLDQMPGWEGFRPPLPRPLHEGPPSERGTVRCGRSKPRYIRIWNPSRLDANPMYSVCMAGDSQELTKARAAWSRGDPKPLREYLAKQADERRMSQQREKEREAA